MIDEAKKIIYIDFSIRGMFQACKEKARLGAIMGYRLKERDDAMDFGHAFHAAIAAYYDALAGGYFDDNFKWHKFPPGAWPSATRIAQDAFLRDLHHEGSTMPLTMDGTEKRSVERGVALVEAYIERWKDEPYDNILNEDGSPLTEIGFAYPLAHYNGYDIVYVGTIDRIMRSMQTGRPVLFETKTTRRGLSQFILQCNPNHQVTGYFKIAWEKIPEIRECVWDCTFVSKRQADMAKALKDRFWMWGIKLRDDKDGPGDFKRQITQRSKTDVTEFLIDLEADALEYAKWLMSGVKRWPRSAPHACHQYKGCQFRNVCMHEGSQNILNTFYEIKPWNPLKRLRQQSEPLLDLE